jgi:hypothetical protein
VATTDPSEVGAGRGPARSRSAERRLTSHGDGVAAGGAGKEALKSGIYEMGLSGAQVVDTTGLVSGSRQGSRLTSRPQTSGHPNRTRVITGRPQTSRCRSPVGFSGDDMGPRGRCIVPAASESGAMTERIERQGDCSRAGEWASWVVGVGGGAGLDGSPPVADRRICSPRGGAKIAGMGIRGSSPPGSLSEAANQRGGGVTGMISLSGLLYDPSEARKWKAFPAHRPRGILSGRH